METNQDRGQSTATAEPQDEKQWMAKPQQEHEWLQQLVGEWTYEAEMKEHAGHPAVKSAGTESVRSLGGLWVQGEGKGELPGDGGEATAILTLGYDPQKGRYIGTWIGSMMTHMWVYEGQLDATGKALALDTEGPSMTGDGKMAKYREVMEVKTADLRTFTSHAQQEDGSWQQLMTTTYRRRAHP